MAMFVFFFQVVIVVEPSVMNLLPCVQQEAFYESSRRGGNDQVVWDG